jgi:phage gp45-like
VIDVTALRRSLRLVSNLAEVEMTDWAQVPPTAQLHLQDGEVQDRVPILGPWGVAYRPPRGARGVAVAQGGDRSQLVLLGAASRAVPPPVLDEGEVALYSAGGAVLRLGLDGKVHVTGDVLVEGHLADFRSSLEEMRALIDAHVHPTPAGPTGVPTVPLAGGGGAEGGGEDQERIPAQTGDLFAFDSTLNGSRALKPGAKGSVLTSQGDGELPAYLPPAPTTDASHLITGELDGGGA